MKRNEAIDACLCLPKAEMLGCSGPWRTQKIFIERFIQWHMMDICIWCALFVTSQFDVILMFPKQRFGEVCWHNMHIFLHPLTLFHCTEYKLLALQVRLSEYNTLNATTQQFITAKISGWTLKQWSKTHSSIRQSSFQLQKEAALMSCRMRAVEHKKVAGVCPCLQDRTLLVVKLHKNWECA